jgi:hypothetical protein
MRRYDIHIAHLGAGGATPLLQSRQVQISSKLHGEKDIGPTCAFAASLEVGLVATVDTLQTGYPYAKT